MYSLAQIKVGVAISVDGHPYVVTNAQFSKQARGSGVMKTTLKSILNGNNIAVTFQGNEKIEPADIHYAKSQFLYAQGDEYFFMDNENYEQFSFKAEELGDKVNYLLDGMQVDIQNFEGKPINVQLPTKVNLKVVEAEPGVKGDTAQGRVTKPVKVETGITVHVPLFVNEGDVIKINTETGEYCERV